MLQEYLVKDAAVKNNIEHIDLSEFNKKAREEIVRTTQESAEGSFWIITFETRLNNEDSAKALDGLSKTVETQEGVIILGKGSSEYYNKKLYPLINDFERLLRKLLYLTAAIKKSEIASKNISDLEKLNFFQLFVLLFVDTKFTEQARKAINEKKDKFTKRQIIEELNNLKESTTWDSLIGNKLSPVLYGNLKELKQYRNEVMHAHNICSDEYENAKHLYETVNQELRTLIQKSEQSALSLPDDFNETIQDAIEVFRKKLHDINASVDFLNLYSILETKLAKYFEELKDIYFDSENTQDEEGI